MDHLILRAIDQGKQVGIYHIYDVKCFSYLQFVCSTTKFNKDLII